MVFHNQFVQLPHSASAHVLHSASTGASTPNLIQVKEFRQQYHHYVGGPRGGQRVVKTPLCTLQSYNEDDANNSDLSEVSCWKLKAWAALTLGCYVLNHEFVLFSLSVCLPPMCSMIWFEISSALYYHRCDKFKLRFLCSFCTYFQFIIWYW